MVQKLGDGQHICSDCWSKAFSKPEPENNWISGECDFCKNDKLMFLHESQKAYDYLCKNSEAVKALTKEQIYNEDKCFDLVIENGKTWAVMFPAMVAGVEVPAFDIQLEYTAAEVEKTDKLQEIADTAYTLYGEETGKSRDEIYWQCEAYFQNTDLTDDEIEAGLKELFEPNFSADDDISEYDFEDSEQNPYLLDKDELKRTIDRL